MPCPLLQNQLFDGLEDEESSFGNDTFVPRRSIKRLVLKGGRLPTSGVSNNSLSQSQSRLEEEEPETAERQTTTVQLQTLTLKAL